MYLMNSDTSTCGLYRAMLTYDGINAKIYIPALANDSSEDLLFTGMFISNEMKKTAQIGQSPCYVTFENGNIRRPIIVGYFGKGIRSIGGTGIHQTTNGDVHFDISNLNIANLKDIFVDANGKDWESGYAILNILLNCRNEDNKRYTLAGICAILGNLWVESYSWNGRQWRFDPLADNGLGFKGLLQWDSSRYANMVKYCHNEGFDVDSVESQTSYICYELQHSYTKVNDKLLDESLNNLNSVEYLSNYVCRYYEVAITDIPGQWNADVYFIDKYLQGGKARSEAAIIFYQRLISHIQDIMNTSNLNKNSLFFIGDSRTVRIFDLYHIPPNILTIAHDAIIGIGISLLDKYINNTNSLKNYDYIIITLGVNDCQNAKKYAEKCNKLLELYPTKSINFVSILPVIDSLSGNVKNKNITEANNIIKNNIKCNYIDIYENVKQKLNKSNCIDGVHYERDLCTDIYNMIINALR